jgi:hypothetical protein
MLLAIFGAMAMGFTIATFVLKTGRMILGFLSAGFWILLAVTAYTSSEAMWDAYYGLFMLSGIMVFACALLPAILKERKEDEPTLDDIDGEDKDILSDIEAGEKDRTRMDRLFGNRKRRKKSKMPYIARTGRIK